MAAVNDTGEGSQLLIVEEDVPEKEEMVPGFTIIISSLSTIIVLSYINIKENVDM
ncbi:MAG: hypothetical protein ACOC5D_05305 [Thermoplasmatota archaeon]